MPYLLLPSREFKPHSEPRSIDWSNPLTRGLAGGFLPVGKSAYNILPSGRVYPAIQTRARHTGGGVVSKNPSATAMYGGLRGVTANAATIFSRRVGNGATTNTRSGSIIGNDSFPILNIQAGDGTNARWGGRYYNGSYTDFGSSAETAMKSNILQTVIVRFKSGLQTVMVDGVKSSSEGTAATTLYSVGNNYDPFYMYEYMEVGLSIVYNRYIEDHEAFELTRNPWQIFEQSVGERLYFIPAATGGSFNAAWACGSNAVIQPGAMQ